MSKTEPHTPSRISIGTITRPHGVRGAFKVHLYNPKSKLLGQLKEILVGRDPEQVTTYPIACCRPANQFFIVKVEGCETREAAERFQGKTLWVNTAELPILEEGEFYHFQLVGLEVYGATGQFVGKVVGVEENSGADNLVIQTKTKRHLVPMIEDAIAEVNLDEKKVVLRDMGGLLDHGF